MDKEFAGQPLWLWLAGAGVVVLGYLYFKSHSSQPSQQAQTGGTGKSTSTSSFKEWIVQHQAPSTTHKTKKTAGQ